MPRLADTPSASTTPFRTPVTVRRSPGVLAWSLAALTAVAAAGCRLEHESTQPDPKLESTGLVDQDAVKEHRDATSRQMATKTLEARCAQGSTTSCGYLAEVFLEQEGTTKLEDVGRFVTALEEGCENGFAEGCGYLGDLYYRGFGVPKDPHKSISLYTVACDAGSSAGCRALGVAHLTGRFAESDVELGRQLLGRACNGGMAQACRELGDAHLSGAFGAADETEALVWFERGCGGGVAASCYNAGILHHGGIGSAQPNLVRAAQAFAKSCKGGDIHGCSAVGKLSTEGQGDKADVEAARINLELSCEGGSVDACYSLAVFYNEGLGVVADPQRAISLVKQACEAGHEQACSVLASL